MVFNLFAWINLPQAHKSPCFGSFTSFRANLIILPETALTVGLFSLILTHHIRALWWRKSELSPA